MAEWLRSGLQIRVLRFESGRGLQYFLNLPVPGSGSRRFVYQSETGTLLQLLRFYSSINEDELRALFAVREAQSLCERGIMKLEPLAKPHLGLAAPPANDRNID